MSNRIVWEKMNPLCKRYTPIQSLFNKESPFSMIGPRERVSKKTLVYHTKGIHKSSKRIL